METLSLHNGLEMPALGLGTWDLRGRTCVETIPRALELGYRLIDTAQMYENEREVGQGLRLAGLPREEVWVTTKLFRPDTTYPKAKEAISRSLDRLGTDYLDLLLIHEPYDTAGEMYRALEEAYAGGLVKAIGISNFHEAQYTAFLKQCQVVPMVNQVESHVYFLRRDLQRTMAAHGTVTQAWAPFTEGRRKIFDEPVLQAVGRHYGKSAAQVALRYLLQNGMGVVVKSARPERLAENFQVFDFTLTPEDLQAVAGLDEGTSLFGWYP